MTPSTGQLLAQRYRLERQIAVGGMGEVWQATDTRLDRQVAVKVLKPELSGDPEFQHRFHTEARLTASLNHPGIAAVYDYGEAVTTPGSAQTAFLVMELVPGDSLATILLRQRRLSTERTLDILGQAGEGLQAAHERGLVHRDIKPGNILVTPHGRVKLTDFGIAKAADTAAVTRQGMVMGTAHYLAPEQAAGHQATSASDVYSLGVVGYECLTGQRPFLGDSAVAVAMMHIRETPPPLPPEVPPGVRALLQAALAKDPGQRYRTGGEFAAAVAAVRAGYPPPPPGAATTAAVTALLPGPETNRYPASYPDGYSDSYSGGFPPSGRAERRSGTRGVVLALCVVLGLVLGGYLIREVVSSTPPVAGADGPGPARSAPPGEPVPTDPETTADEPPAPEPSVTDEQPGNVSISLTDYLLRSGSDAADLAESRGLAPQVIDDNGDEIDSEDWATCRVVRVDPAFGSVPAGSTVVLTCREGL